MTKLPKGEKLRLLSGQIIKDNPGASHDEHWQLFAEEVDRQNRRRLRRNGARRRLGRNGERTQLQRDREARGRALTNAEKQKRWRERHTEDRRKVARVAAMLMRRSHTEGHTTQFQVGWNWVTADVYFLRLAVLICDVLKTDRAIKQLRWALAQRLVDRRIARETQARSQKASPHSKN